jgi:O-antigen/teichoic acid export membrane protein
VAAVALTLPAIAAARWVASAIGVPDSVGGYGGPTLLAVALAGVAATALSGALSTLFQATGRFGWISALTITNAALTLVFAVALALAKVLDIMTALLVLGILPSLFGFAVGRMLLGPEWSLRPPSREKVAAEAPPLFRIGGWLWLAGLLTAVAGRLDLLLVNGLSSPRSVGAYGLAFSLAASLGAVGGSLYTVLLPAASGLRRASEVRRYLRHGLVRSAALSLALLPLLVLARPFITLVYGQAYAPAAPLFQLFIPVVALELLVMPLMLLVVPLDQPQWLAAAGGLRAILVAVLGRMLLPVWGPPGAVAARGVALAASAGLLAVVVARAGGRRWAATEAVEPGHPPTAGAGDAPTGGPEVPE